ncbi:MAG TPA: RNA polymerase sigma factor WhiG [Hydrogenispora sp.]|jgi:RNA polymerase sigma factor for flagellar operon FliA|nr:RNA polymerase sigma factor WhiG [Hydrogenispora sp.]
MISKGRDAQLWKEYRQGGSDAAREQLIEGYAPLVKYVAGRVAIGLPPNVEFDDLVSYGIFGLIDAIDKFDPERGIKFETYAIARIRGAIMDGLRNNDWVPRSVRQKAKELEKVCSELENRLGRYATDQEISESLNISLDEFHRLLNEVSCTTLSSLDELWLTRNLDDDSVRVLDLIENEDSSDPEKLVEIAELKVALAKSIDALSEREKLVITLYYYEGLTLKEIGQTLNISESRVSQIHTKAIFRLQGRLARWRTAIGVL